MHVHEPRRLPVLHDPLQPGVAAVTVGDWQNLVNAVDAVDVRASWPPTDHVVFQVEADTGDGTWSIELDTPAGATPPSATTPAPTPTQ